MNSERDSDQRTKVYRWLEKSGYPLEMTVAQAFRESNCDFHVSQAQYYLDPQDNRPREMDVVVSRLIGQEINGRRIRLDVYFCIECKSTPDKPWIVFTSERTSVYEIVFGFDFLSPVISTPARDFAFQLARQGKIQVANMFKPHTRRGYGVTQAFTTGKDVPYEAIMGAVKAAHAMVAPYSDFTSSRPPKTVPVGLAIPIIVIEGGLFECYLEETEKRGSRRSMRAAWSGAILCRSTKVAVQFISTPRVHSRV